MSAVQTVFQAVSERNIDLCYVTAVVVIVRILIRNFPKKYSYCLWSVVGIRMAFALPFTSVLSIFHVQDLITERLHLAQSAIVTKTVTDSMTADSVSYSNAIAKNGHLLSLCSALSVVWMTGMIACILFMVWSYLKTCRLVRTAVRKEGNVFECDGLSSPFAFGLIRPKIYIPFHLPEHEQSYILKHEFYHIQRKDLWIKMVSFLFAAVFWMNPLVWLSYFLMLRDMEMSCDEAVILQLGDGIKGDYSKSLLSFATGRQKMNFAPMAFGESNTAKRIKNVLSYKKPKRWCRVVCVITIFMAAAVCLTDASAKEIEAGARPFVVADGIQDFGTEKVGSTQIAAVCPFCKKGVVETVYTWGEWINEEEVDCTHHRYGTDMNQTRGGVKTVRCTSCARGDAFTVSESRVVCHGFEE